MIAILHNIRSLHNVGSIFRTADAAGVKKLYLCGITPAPTDRFGKLRGQFAKVSLGAERYVEWQKIPKTEKLIEKLKKDGYKIFAVEQSKKSTSHYKLRGAVTRHSAIALVVGNEIMGLPESILKKSDKILEIPMRGAMVRQAHHPRRVHRGKMVRQAHHKESLNVAVAFGIVVYNLIH